MSQPTALLLTVVVEVPLYVTALVALRLAGPWRAGFAAVAANLLTHPVLWWTLGDRPPVPAVALAEVAVWLAETGLVWLALRRDAPLVGVVAAGANAASVLAGALIALVA